MIFKVKNLLTIQTDEEVPVKNVTIRRIPKYVMNSDLNIHFVQNSVRKTLPIYLMDKCDKMTFSTKEHREIT